jgi:effector-binding domain-containing protein
MRMNYDVRLEQVSSRPVAVVRRRAQLKELGKVIPAACGLVWNVIKPQKITGAGRHVAIYWDEAINLEVGVELDAPFAGSGEVVGSAIPGGTIATAVHFGPYDRLPDAHQAIRQWCAQQGHLLAGANWELYGHWQQEWCDDPAKIRTDVCYLLKSAT